MKEIVTRLHENRQVALAKSILESNGYIVEEKSSSYKDPAESALLKLGFTTEKYPPWPSDRYPEGYHKYNYENYRSKHQKKDHLDLSIYPPGKHYANDTIEKEYELAGYVGKNYVSMKKFSNPEDLISYIESLFNSGLYTKKGELPASIPEEVRSHITSLINKYIPKYKGSSHDTLEAVCSQLDKEGLSYDEDDVIELLTDIRYENIKEVLKTVYDKFSKDLPCKEYENDSFYIDYVDYESPIPEDEKGFLKFVHKYGLEGSKSGGDYFLWIPDKEYLGDICLEHRGSEISVYIGAHY